MTSWAGSRPRFCDSVASLTAALTLIDSNWKRRVGRGQLEAVFRRIADDEERGDEPGHVPGRLEGQVGEDVPEAVEVVDLLGPDDPLDGRLAAVVGGDGRRPVAEHVVELDHVLDGRPGGLDRVHALVDVLVLLEAVTVARRADELPHAQGPGPGQGPRLEGALDERDPGQLLRQALLAQLLEDHVPVLAGPPEGFLEGLSLYRLERLDLPRDPLVLDEGDGAVDRGGQGRPGGRDLLDALGDEEAKVLLLLEKRGVGRDGHPQKEAVGLVELGQGPFHVLPPQGLLRVLVGREGVLEEGRGVLFLQLLPWRFGSERPERARRRDGRFPRPRRA